MTPAVSVRRIDEPKLTSDARGFASRKKPTSRSVSPPSGPTTTAMRASPRGQEHSESPRSIACASEAVWGASSQQMSTAVASASSAAASFALRGSSTSGMRGWPCALRDGKPSVKSRSRFLRVKLHDGALAGQGHECRHAKLGRMSNDRIHLLTLGKSLHKHHKRAVVGRLLVARDAHEGEIIVEGCNLAFEVILSRIDDRDVLARG